jgi:hypothetical protein
MVMNQFLFECTLNRVRQEIERHCVDTPYMRPKSLAEFEDLLLVIIFCSRCEDGDGVSGVGVGGGEVKGGCDWQVVDKLATAEAEELAPLLWPYVADICTPTRASLDAWQVKMFGTAERSEVGLM